MILSAFFFVRDALTFGRTIWDGAYFSFGGREEMVYGHDAARIATISVEFGDKSTSKKLKLTLGTGQAAFEYTLASNPPNKWSIQVRSGLTESITSELKNVWLVSAFTKRVPLNEPIGQGLQQIYQPFDPDGRLITNYLLGRWSDRDSKWNVAEEWLRKIDPDLKILKTPLAGTAASLKTNRTQGELTTDVSLSSQGAGIQNAISIISALVFSPDGSTIVVEEPESHLHPRAQEMLVDLANLATKEWNKQVVLITHSWNVLLPYVSDVGAGTPRGREHVKTDETKFSLVTFSRGKSGIEVERKSLANAAKYVQTRDEFKKLWG